MPDSNTSRRPHRRMPFRKKLLIASGGALGLLVLAYFVVTSTFFLKSVILPRVGKTLGATVTVDDASVSPFSQLILRGLKVQTAGSDPLLAAEEVRLRYGLRQILGGTIAVDELKLVAPAVTLVQHPDGTSNLDPILKALSSGPDNTAKPKQSQPPKLAIRDIAIKQARIQVIRESQGGRSIYAIAPLDLTIDKLVGTEPGKLTLGVEASCLMTAPGHTNALQARGSGAFTFKLAPDFMPEVQGTLRLEVVRAEGAFAEARTLALNLDCDLAPNELRNLALRFEQAGRALGQLRVTGPMELTKSEGRLKIDVTAIDRQVLNLVGAPMGLDFAGTTLAATNLVDIAQKGGVIAAKGQISGRNVSLKRDALTTPAMELDVDYQVTLNLAGKNAVVQKLSLQARQARQEVLRAGLDRPMTVAWGDNVPGFKESSFNLAVTQLNLADWKPILGQVLPAGLIDVQLGAVAQQDGKQLKIDLRTRATDVTVLAGSNRIVHAGLTFQAGGQFEDFRTVTVNDYSMTLTRGDQTLLTAGGKASYDLKDKAPGLQLTMETALPGLMQFAALTNVSVSSGGMKLNALYSQKPGQTNVSGSVLISELTGRFGDYSVNSYQASLEWDLEVKSGLVGINRAAIGLRQGFDRVGNIDLNGKFEPEKRKGQAAFNITGLRERALLPFLAPHLQGMTLSSMLVNASGTASYDAVGDTAAKAEVKVTDLVLKDTAGRLPGVPLNLDMQFDGSLREPQFTLNQFVVAISTAGSGGGASLPGGVITANAKVDTKSMLGEAGFKIAGLNQNSLAPFLAASIAPNRLVSGALNAEGTAKFDPKGATTAVLALSLTNLVPADAAGKLLEKPLALEVQLDAGMTGAVIDLKKLALALAPTARATNRLQLSGKVDLSATNATPSQLSLRSDGLDVTPYYDLFAGLPQTNAQPASAPVAATKPAVEPDPVSLPFQQFTLDAKIDRFYLREVAASNFIATVRLNHGVAELPVLQTTLNGAPVKGNGVLNLAVKGWTYDVSLSADRLPFEPLARSFFPQVVTSIGNYEGQLVLDAKVKGAGITGAGLRRSLSGNVDFSFTNANIQVIKSEAKIWFIPINLKLLATFLGVPELMQSPVNALNTKVKLGDGQIALREVNVLSDAFVAEVSGTIPIREPLTDSPLDLGVDLSLRRSLAQRARLVSADPQAGDGYVKLPRMVSVAGTLGKPETKTDKVALTAVTARTAAGLVGGKAGNAIQGAGNLLENVGGLISGQRPAPSLTNAVPVVPSTNTAPRANPLDLLRRTIERKP